MSIFIPAHLNEQILTEFDEEGERWLTGLPKRIAALERRWRCRTGPAFDHGGAVSWVAPVQLEEGGEAVLKIGFPHDEARFEADALRFLNGHGTVRLLQASEDGFSLLLERCVPGTDLWSLSEAEGDAVACRILPRLWQELTPATPFVSLTDFAAAWWKDIPQAAAAGKYEVELAAEAVARGRELAASQPQHVLLHGDFHPGNVLAAQREPWLVIDPKPLVGDPAYDLAQWLYNRSGAALRSADPVSALRGQVKRLAASLGLDPRRIAGWTFVKALGWEWGQEAAALFQQVAQD